MNKIFVQIASYRDPELIPTIEDCLSKADKPENLTFGICNQFHDEDKWDLDKYRDNPNFTIQDVPWNESKGLCWARSEIQKMWKGEEWTLQIDSHHRFLQGWDTELLKMVEQTNSPKPIITAYAGMYDPKENKLLNDDPFKMVGKKFTPSGTILFYPERVHNWKELTQPFPARFVSGHFFFTIGKHCEEYKYDPNLYFAGDEISLSIRSYTLGYDLFHPHKTIVWHEYTREGRVKHWDDFVEKNQEKIEKRWHEMDVVSKKRLRKMLREEDNDSDITGYDLGNVRTHLDYELYAGIDFKNRILHKDTMNGILPPTMVEDTLEWRKHPLKPYSIEIDWSKDWVNLKKDISCACTFQFIMFGIHDKEDNVIYRWDAVSETDGDYVKGGIRKKTFNFESHTEPTKIVIWPYEKDKGWVNRIEKKI